MPITWYNYPVLNIKKVANKFVMYPINNVGIVRKTFATFFWHFYIVNVCACNKGYLGSLGKWFGWTVFVHMVREMHCFLGFVWKVS